MAKKQKEANGHDATAEASATPGDQTITIKDLKFTAPAPYAEGHVCTAGEASALNQVYGENLRNNFAKRVSTAKENWEKENPGQPIADHIVAELQTQFSAYAAEYEFHGKRRSTRGPVDPVEKEAFKLAKERIVAKLRERNMDLKTLPDGQLDTWVNELLSKDPSFREEATRRVEASKAIANTALDLDQLVQAAASA
jgi:hypothetical protein